MNFLYYLCCVGIVIGDICIAIAIYLAPRPHVAHAQAEAMPPNIQLIRRIGWTTDIYKFQDGPNDCYVAINDKSSISCVRREAVK